MSGRQSATRTHRKPRKGSEASKPGVRGQARSERRGADEELGRDHGYDLSDELAFEERGDHRRGDPATGRGDDRGAVEP